jgi:hypothetical protein
MPDMFARGSPLPIITKVLNSRKIAFQYFQLLTSSEGSYNLAPGTPSLPHFVMVCDRLRQFGTQMRPPLPSRERLAEALLRREHVGAGVPARPPPGRGRPGYTISWDYLDLERAYKDPTQPFSAPEPNSSIRTRCSCIPRARRFSFCRPRERSRGHSLYPGYPD